MTEYVPPTKRRGMTPTVETVRERFDYDPDTGILTWRNRSGNAKKGSRAGCASHWNGYRVVSLSGRQHQEHRIAWLHFYGAMPAGHIDHINGDRSDNRIANLRECSAAENAQNRKLHADNKSGYQGVHLTPKGKWRAQIKVRGFRHYLGDFSSPELAHAAYLGAKRVMHPFSPKPREGTFHD